MSWMLRALTALRPRAALLALTGVILACALVSMFLGPNAGPATATPDRNSITTPDGNDGDLKLLHRNDPDVSASPGMGQCILTRSPILLPMAMPAHLDSLYDEDGNGLDDEIEEEIAQCAAPEFRFDCGEPWWSLGPEEPHLVFNSFLDEIDGEDLHITIQYGAVWAYDGGFATSGGACHDTNEHAGDTQGLTVTVTVRPTELGLIVFFESIDLPDIHYPYPPAEMTAEGRVIVYPSAGKHHWYAHPGEYDYDMWCGENAYGNCAIRVPTVEHLPMNIEYLERTVVDHDGWVSHHWCNASFLRKGLGCHPAGNSLRRIDLFDWRFPECHFSEDGCDDQDSPPGDWFYIAYPDFPHIMDSYFMDPDITPIWALVQGGFADDVDGDGLPFWFDPCPAHGSNGIDTDGDGLGSTCDPQNDVPNVYVAGGAPGYPALRIGPMAGFLNHPPVCDLNGPYVAECEGTTTDVPLDGSASSDPDPGDILTYSWTTNIPSGTFDDATSATPTLTVDTDPGCVVNGNVHLDVIDYGGLSNFCYNTISIRDTSSPDIVCPADLTIECDEPTDPSNTGDATATDVCDTEPPAITFSDWTPPIECAGNYTITRKWTATDTCDNFSSCEQTVVVVDTTPPEVFCNALSAITPPDAPIAFTATATDNCDDETVVEITEYDCFMLTKKGKHIDKTESCIVSIVGDTITIIDSGGVDDHITWIARATDCSGNVATTQCSVDVVRPFKRKSVP